MNEADWLAAKEPELMLVAIHERLSPRRAHLLATAMVRRVLDILPEGYLRQAVDWCEKNAGKTHDHKQLETWLEKIRTATKEAEESARSTQHEIVRTADPDADPDSFQAIEAKKTNPAVALFQGASRFAHSSVEEAAQATIHAAQAVAMLAMMPPDDAQLVEVRRLVVDASIARSASGLYASTALKLKSTGDDAADRDNRKNVNVRYAAGLDTVTKEEETLNTKLQDIADQKRKADRKALGRLLHELAGNPFRPYRFEQEWRTKTVTTMAKEIYADRLFDRMPILADAVLDTDCDEESVLRHLRGTEAHAPEGAMHTRGCWVLDLILKQEPVFFKAPPLEASTTKAEQETEQTSRAEAAAWERLFGALGDMDDAPKPKSRKR